MSIVNRERSMTIGVTAVGSGVGQVVLDALRTSPFNVRIVGFEATGCAKGLYECDEGYRLPLASDSSYGGLLREYCQREDIRLLIPGSDPELPVLAEIAPSLEAQGCKVLVGSPASVHVCQDKKAFYEHLSPSDLPVVTTLLLSEVLRDPDVLSYPVILKPRCGAGSVGVRVIGDPSEWRAITSRLGVSGGENWVVQPFLRPVTWGDGLWEEVKTNRTLVQKSQLCFQAFLSGKGEVLGHMAYLADLKSGVPMRIELVDDPSVWEAVEPLVAAFTSLGARGPLNLQGALTEEGVRFFEANLRFSGSTQVRSLMGYREVEAAVRHFALQEPLEEVKACLAPVLSRVGLRQMTERVVPSLWVRRFEDTGRLGISLPLKRAVVTGASGYLGYTILQTLLEQALVEEVVAPVRDPARAEATWAGHPRKGCVRFLPWRGKVPPPGLEAAELVIHAAAVRPPCAERPGDLFEENLSLTHAAVQGVRRHQTPLLIYISSQSVYAQCQPPPWDEETPLAPDSPYGYSKAAGEVAVQLLDGSPTRWAILRLSRLYGWSPQVHWNGVTSCFAALALKGLPLPVHGDGQQTLDLLHVRDACDFIATLLSSPLSVWNTVYNVGSGSPIPVLELARLYRDLAKTQYGTSSLVEVVPQAEQPLSWGLSIRRAQETLGWYPKISLTEGLSELMVHVPEIPAEGDSPIRLRNPVPKERSK